MKKASIQILLIFLAISTTVSSQTRKRNYRQNELGIMVGGSYYIGDLNPRKQFFLSQPAGGLFYRFAPNYRYAFRFGINAGTIIGDDSKSKQSDQQQRNLNFKSQIIEYNALAEFNFLEYRLGTENYYFTTFLFLGLDVFTFNPQTRLNNTWVDLQPLKTEGQSKSYALTQVAVPFGIGLKLNLLEQVGLGLEWGPRKTYTDYLDDVSGTYPNPEKNPFHSDIAAKLSDRSKNAGSNINEQRGNPRTKDWYIFFGASLNFKFNVKAPPCYTH